MRNGYRQTIQNFFETSLLIWLDAFDDEMVTSNIARSPLLRTAPKASTRNAAIGDASEAIRSWNDHNEEMNQGPKVAGLVT